MSKRRGEDPIQGGQMASAKALRKELEELEEPGWSQDLSLLSEMDSDGEIQEGQGITVQERGQESRVWLGDGCVSLEFRG